jgi:hypothetical protein
MLVRLAQERQPPAWTPPPRVYHELRQRLVARDALIATRTQVRNQRHALQQWPVVITSVLAHLDAGRATVTTQIAQLEQELAAVVADGAWARAAALLQSIPGGGVVTAAWLLVTSVNFTVSRTPAGLTAYAGLAPMPHESGTSIRGQPRMGHRGNTHLRHALSMATLSASRHNPMIRVFYQRLRDGGKPIKVARWAAARKLLHLAWAVVTKEQRFTPIYREPLRLSLSVSRSLEHDRRLERRKSIDLCLEVEASPSRTPQALASGATSLTRRWGERPGWTVPKTTLLFWAARSKRRLPCAPTTGSSDLTSNTISRLRPKRGSSFYMAGHTSQVSLLMHCQNWQNASAPCGCFFNACALSAIPYRRDASVLSRITRTINSPGAEGTI